MTDILVDLDPAKRDYPYRKIAQKALGRALPTKAVVHHIDENRKNNEPANLVVCPDQAYHMILHARQRVIGAGGSPWTQKVCKYCKSLLPKEAFSFETSWDDRAAGCRECTNARRKGKKKYQYWNDKTRQQQRDRRALAAN